MTGYWVRCCTDRSAGFVTCRRASAEAGDDFGEVVVLLRLSLNMDIHIWAAEVCGLNRPADPAGVSGTCWC